MVRLRHPSLQLFPPLKQQSPKRLAFGSRSSFNKNKGVASLPQAAARMRRRFSSSLPSSNARDGVTASRVTASRRYLILLLLAMSAGLGFAGAAAAQGATQDATPSRLRFVRWTYEDAGSLALGAGRQAPLILLAAPLLGTASLADERALTTAQEEYEGPWAAYLDGSNELGNSRMLPATAGLFAVSLVTDDTRFQDAAFTSFQSVLYARLITNAIKGVVGRVRPEDGQGPHALLPFSGNRSFPSGHTTTAFAAITPWVFYYPNVATYGLLALSAGTAIARVTFDKHWPTDVLAGAAVGFFVGRYLSKRHLATASSHSDDRADVAFGSVAGAAGMGMGLHVGLDLSQRDRRSARETMHVALGPALDLGGLGLALKVRFK